MGSGSSTGTSGLLTASCGPESSLMFSSHWDPCWTDSCLHDGPASSVFTAGSGSELPGMLTSCLCPLSRVSRSRVEPSRAREDLSCRDRSLSHFFCQNNYKHWVICCYRSTWEAHGTSIRWRLSSFSPLLGTRDPNCQTGLWKDLVNGPSPNLLYSYQHVHEHIWKILKVLLWTMNTMVCCAFGLLSVQTQSLPAFTGPFHPPGSQHLDQHRNMVASAVLMGKSGKIKKKV